MTRQASTVIVGGGVWGLSTAYHLARTGRTDVQVLERNGKLFDETTSQAAGLVGQIRATPLMRRAIRYAIDLFMGFGRETSHDPGFRQVGSLLALTPERMTSFEEHIEHANRNGVEARFVDERRCPVWHRTWTLSASRASTSSPRMATLTLVNARGPFAPPPKTWARGSGRALPRQGFRCGTAGWWGWRPTAVWSRRSRSW